MSGSSGARAGSRTTSRCGIPCSASSSATLRPTAPVAPVTAINPSAMRLILPLPGVRLDQRSGERAVGVSRAASPAGRVRDRLTVTETPSCTGSAG